MQIKLTSTEACVAVAVMRNLCFEDYRLLSSWLGCYSYIFPADRYLDAGFLCDIVGYDCMMINSSSQIFKAWLTCNLIEGALTKEQQRRVLRWIHQ